MISKDGIPAGLSADLERPFAPLAAAGSRADLLFRPFLLNLPMRALGIQPGFPWVLPLPLVWPSLCCLPAAAVATDPLPVSGGLPPLLPCCLRIDHALLDICQISCRIFLETFFFHSCAPSMCYRTSYYIVHVLSATLFLYHMMLI